MQVPLINKLLTNTDKQVCKSIFEKEISKLMQQSEDAMRELSNESLNSETLKAIFMPNFRPQKPGQIMAVSTKLPNKPVEVGYEINKNGQMVTIDIFSKGPNIKQLGHKFFSILKNSKDIPVMFNGCMVSYEDACRKAGVKGIGILQDLLQVKCAIENGINKIPCYSRAIATLFHVKMGFKPVQWLEQIHSLGDIEKIIKRVTNDPCSRIAPKHYTPIIISKGANEKEYFLDTNTTQCIANIRQIKENLSNGIKEPYEVYFDVNGVDMILEGENYDFWKRNVKEMFSKV